MLGLALCQTQNWREVVGLLPASLFAESRESQWNENVALYVQLIQNTEVCKNTKHYESKRTSIYDSELLK